MNAVLRQRHRSASPSFAPACRGTCGSDWGYRRMVLHYAKLCAPLGWRRDAADRQRVARPHKRAHSAPAYPGGRRAQTLPPTSAPSSVRHQSSAMPADGARYANHRTLAGAAASFKPDPLGRFQHPTSIALEQLSARRRFADGTAASRYTSAAPPRSTTAPICKATPGRRDYYWYYASDGRRAAPLRNPTPYAWSRRGCGAEICELVAQRATTITNLPTGTEKTRRRRTGAQAQPSGSTELGCPGESTSCQPVQLSSTT